MKKAWPVYAFFLVLLFLEACKHEPFFTENPGDFPVEIKEIITLECAVSGCHNDASKGAAGGLSLTSWNKLFEGGFGGSAVVPYRADQSYLAMYINTYEDLGVMLEPTMPYNDQPLRRDQVELIMDWINEGAPNASGFVKFSDNPVRSKFYVTNQGCDLVAVFDRETRQIMRYIDVGTNPSYPEAPHMVKVSPDRQYWYVIFSSNGSVIQKFRTSDDSYVGEVNIGNGSWNTFSISPDGKTAFVVNFENDGAIAVVDLENLQLLETYSGSGLLVSPHGSALSPGGQTLYVTAQIGNYVYRIDVADIHNPDITEISLDKKVPNSASSLDPHEIIFSSDGKFYFVSCQGTNEVRVMDSAADTLYKVIPVGGFPQEFAISKSLNYLLVTCMEDEESFAGKRGSVSIISTQSLAEVKRVFTGYQPHGIAVDEEAGLAYVANRNATSEGPAPHHSTECGGRNGYITAIDLNTLKLLPGFKAEVSVDPYSIALRP